MRSTIGFLAAGAVVILLLAAFLPASLQSGEPASLSPSIVDSLANAAVDDNSAAQHGLVVQSMSAMPLAFTENKGQWDEQVLFRANAGGATMWFCKDRIVYQFTRRIPSRSRESGKPDELAAMPGAGASPHGPAAFDPRERFEHEKDSVEQSVVTAKFAGANPSVEVVGEGEMEYKCNYFLGNDPAKWRADVPNYTSVVYKEIYPGVDLRCSGEGNGKAGYEFLAGPGADLAQVKVEYEGVKELSVDETGRLIARTDWGDMIAAIQSPTNGAGSESRRFSLLSGKTLGFGMLCEGHQQLAVLTVGIDYSTYLGGSSSDDCQHIAVDGSGYAYVTGTTLSTDFPTQNPYHTYYAWFDAFVTKLSSAGNALVYSTYLGGSVFDAGLSVALDGASCVYVTGQTTSSDFPTLNPFQSYQGDLDAFATKLSSAGNALVYSTYLGGNGDDWGVDIDVDGAGCAYVTGSTESINFPTQNPCQADQDTTDVFVTKLSSAGNAVQYSTYLGGSDEDWGICIAIDGAGCAYVSGNTNSTDFPTQNQYQTNQNGTDAFVTKLSSAGDALEYSTYLGGDTTDYSEDVAVDDAGCAYIAGITYSANFPTRNPYQTDQSSTDAFVTKLSSAGNTLEYSTYLGGNGDDWGLGIDVDGADCAYVTGSTGSTNFPTQNPYQTDQGSGDVFVTKLSSTGNSLIYSTYLGGSDYDRTAFGGIAIDGAGCAYVTGYTYSTDFPTQNPFQTYQDQSDVFVTKLCPWGSGTPPPALWRFKFSTKRYGYSVSLKALKNNNPLEVLFYRVFSYPDASVDTVGKIPSAADCIEIVFVQLGCTNQYPWRLVAAKYVNGRWSIQNLPEWIRLHLFPPFNATQKTVNLETLALPVLWDTLATDAETTYVSVNLEDWMADPRPMQDSYIITDGACPDLPGFIFGNTPIAFDSMAGPEDNPFSTEPFTGEMQRPGESGLAPCDCASFGDLNLDANINPLDVVTIVNFVYKQLDTRQQVPYCMGDNGDWNCDGAVNPVDVVRYVNYVYKAQTNFPPCDPCGCTVYPPVNPGDCPPWP